MGVIAKRRRERAAVRTSVLMAGSPRLPPHVASAYPVFRWLDARYVPVKTRHSLQAAAAPTRSVTGHAHAQAAASAQTARGSDALYRSPRQRSADRPAPAR